MIESHKLTSNSDGLEISVLTCADAVAPKAVFQLVHGMCEHKERYVPFMEFLASKGYAVIIHDHRGHGESVRSAEECTADRARQSRLRLLQPALCLSSLR